MSEVKQSKIKNENFTVIQGWMINSLNLKGNVLMIYAIIYGFSQAESQKYSGGLQYLADWINSTKRTVMNCLNELIERNLLEKEEKIINGVKFCEYKVTDLSDGGISLVVNNFHMGGEKISPNNISNIYIKDIVEYLNLKANTSYKHTTRNTIEKINARLNEGYTVDDFKNVIDKKCDEWLGTDMEKFLRPETLFGTKFENYLNQKSSKQEQKKVNTAYDQYEYF